MQGETGLKFDEKGVIGLIRCGLILFEIFKSNWGIVFKFNLV
jgi:hypothetical protein